jgi:uncharacterized protein YegP (UPF0339 family)
MNGFYVLSMTDDEQVMFTLYSHGLEIALTSDPYITKSQALDVIELIRLHGTDATKYQREVSTCGDPYFVLEDSDGEVIACSELHHSSAAMERAIQCLIENASSKTIKDLT